MRDVATSNPAPRTALAAAFVKAGYEPPDERLRSLAVEAWAKWPKQEAGGARRDYVIAALRGEMTWHMAEYVGQTSHLTMMVGALLNRVKIEIEAERPERDAGRPAGGGQLRGETQTKAAPAMNRAQPATAARGSGEASHHAKPRPPTPSAPTLSPTMQAKLAVAARLSRLDTVTIDGRPIGDCTVAEVRMWATRRQADARAASRDARFALALVANLPGGELIRDWWRDPAEVERIYERAEADHAA